MRKENYNDTFSGLAGLHLNGEAYPYNMEVTLL